MIEPYVFEEPSAPDQSVSFDSLERPHNDSLTLVLVKLRGQGLEAESSVETLDGDGGVDLDSERPTPSGSTSDLAHLSTFLEGLGTGTLWDGQRRWRSLGRELEVFASADPQGHVSLKFKLEPQPEHQTWSATCTIELTLGELQSSGRRLNHWVQKQMTDTG